MSEFADELLLWRAHVTVSEHTTIEDLIRSCPTSEREIAAVGDDLRERLGPYIVGPCLAWMAQRALWKQPDRMASAQADIVAALRSLVSVEVPEVVAEVQASRLALSAGLGGLVAGGIVGFVFSGLLGGGWGVAVLASALGSTWAVGTGGRWLDAKGARLLHPVTRWIVHPVTKWIGGILPATPGTPSEAEVRRALEAAWESAVDLAFAECLLHPDRLDPQSARSAAPYVETAPIGLDQITELMALLRAESVDRDEIVETVRDLAQEFAHAGWSWRWIDRGTPYEDKFAESFERVGLLRDGEPVVSRRAAVFRSGKLLRRGLLTRMQ